MQEKLFQKANGDYLPAASQPNDTEKQYAPHKSTRYTNVTLGENGIAKRLLQNNLIECASSLPELYADRTECCGCTACLSVCPLSGPSRPQQARRWDEDGNPLTYLFSFGNSETRRFLHSGAITMLPDEEGFLYPVIDASLCVRCYRCLQACAFKQDLRQPLQ